MVLVRFSFFPKCARYPNNYQHFPTILLGSGLGFGMLKFPPTIFFISSVLEAPREPKLPFSRTRDGRLEQPSAQLRLRARGNRRI